MFEWLRRLAFWILSIWQKLSPQEKRKIIEAIVDWFEDIIRRFYRSQKRKDEKEEG